MVLKVGLAVVLSETEENYTEDEIDTITVYHATAKVGCPKFMYPTRNYGRGVGTANGWQVVWHGINML